MLTYEDIDPKVRRAAMAGLALGMLIACMDGTIIGTCGTVIATDLGGLDLYSWMVAAYLLCETAVVPIAGKLSDRFGRKPIFLTGLALFICGSVACGLSTSMTMLIGFRAIQGLGGGALMPVAMAAVADFYGPAERGKIQGSLGAVFGIGNGIGPLVGGFICTYVSWHWVFFINVPLAVICLVLTLKKFPDMESKPTGKIDFAGMAVLTLIVLDVLLYFQWISDDMEFLEARSIAMIAGGIVAAAVLVLIEKKVSDPVLAPKLIHNRTVMKSAAYLFIMGLAMIGTLTYIAMYIITVYEFDTMKCGLCLLPMVFGMMITAMGSGHMVSKTGYRVWVVAGSVMMVLDLFAMSFLGASAPLWMLLACLFIFGLGLGCVNSTVMVAVQNSTAPSEMGMTTSAVNLMRNIGSTVGTATFALIVSSCMDSGFASTVFGPMADAMGLHGTGLLAMTHFGNAELTSAVVGVFADGMSMAFICVGALYVLALAIAFTMDKGYTATEGRPAEE